MLVEQALQALKSGRLAEAETIYRQIISKDPRNFDALHMLGIVCSEKGSAAEAEQFFRAALSVNCTSVPCHLNFALHYFKRRQYALAIEQFDTVISYSPNYGPAHSDRGCALAELGRMEEAAASHDKAIAIAPNVARVWYNRAFMHYRKRAYPSALQDYDQALRCSNNNYADAWNGRGNVLADLRRYDESINAYDKALGLQPNLAEAWNGRGNVCTRLRRYGEATAASDKALSIKPDLAEAWLGRGNVLAGERRHDDAIAAYERALSLRSDMAEAWNGCGDVFTVLKRYDQAAAAFDKALALNPNSAEAWLGRGTQFFALKRYDDAFAAYDRAAILKADFAEAWFGRGRCHCQQGRIEEAIKEDRRALELGGERELILYELAQLGAEEAPTATPEGLVKNIFDDYAETFDDHLVNKLKYQTPAKLFSLIEAADLKKPDVLDLGCGTGLMGEKLRPIAKSLTGVDLSEGMLKKAQQRAIYDELACSEISGFLSAHSQQYDLVVASDVFVYVGDLAAVFQSARKALKHDGLFCFSVEAIDTGSFVLRTTGRYAHSREYLEALAATHGFAPETIAPTIIRQESSKDVRGYICMMRCS
jgi:predicted TPR repeat methyltransferase